VLATAVARQSLSFSVFTTIAVAKSTLALPSYAVTQRLQAWPSRHRHRTFAADERVLRAAEYNALDDALDTAPFKVRIELMGRICWV